MRGVTVSHPHSPDMPVLTGVDWEVQAGECWVVTGLQGSGKTALLETATGLHPSLAGEVQAFGGPVTGPGDEPARRRLRLALVFDGNGRLFPGLNVFENVALPVCYHGNSLLETAAPWVNELLTGLELDRMADVPAGRLGRSWARRVALARALALKPDAVLLDNPLAGLDAVHLRWFRTFLQQLLAGHPLLGGAPRTLVIASDEVRPLLSLGQKFAVVADGSWRVVGDRATFEKAEEPLLRDLMAGHD